MFTADSPFALVCVCLCSMAFIGVSCRAKEVELPFETIERRDISPPFGRYTEGNPKVTIIDSAEDIGLIEGEVTPELVEKLQQLDYGQYVALVVFQGSVAEILSPDSEGHQGYPSR